LSYLTDLTLRLAAGASLIEPELRSRHCTWLQSRQRGDGGFAGREGQSDPYYTAFALRGLLVVDGISQQVAERAAEFFRSRLGTNIGVVDLVSLVMGASILELTHGIEVLAEVPGAKQRIIETLQPLRSSDGGYAKMVGGVAGSTYQTFLNLLCYELLGYEDPDPEGIAGFLDAQRLIDGGFREIRVAKRAGVNPTAAGIGALKTLGRLERGAEEGTIGFLADMQTDEGGLAANDRIALADLLSSCTGMVTMCDLQAVDQLNLPALRRYALSMQRREADGVAGGFHGFAFDQEVDVEYTFYGLALLALCEAYLAEAPQQAGATS
jgi:geranylgeranyl transferase type-2 subunit beta